MINGVLLILVILFAPVVQSQELPLGLPWGKKLDYNFMSYKNYRYYSGTVEWGQMRFIGQISDEFESELLIVFVDSKISRAYMILGPHGINENNCKKQYNRIVDALTYKYGDPNRREVIKESLMEDLVFVSECYAIAVGVAEIVTKWKTKTFEIEVVVFSDKRETYIEVGYTYIPLKEKDNSDFYKNF